MLAFAGDGVRHQRHACWRLAADCPTDCLARLKRERNKAKSQHDTNKLRGHFGSPPYLRSELHSMLNLNLRLKRWSANNFNAKNTRYAICSAPPMRRPAAITKSQPELIRLSALGFRAGMSDLLILENTRTRSRAGPAWSSNEMRAFGPVPRHAIWHAPRS